MSNQNNDPAIPEGAQALLDLFDGELSGLRFADVDQKLLTDAAGVVRERAQGVARAEAALQAAREALQEGQEALLHRCQRGLAYARIYAEGDAELSRRLDAISLPRKGGRGAGTDAAEPRPQAPARRQRRSTASGGLFLETPPEAPPQENGVSH